jgi:class 3 adenylate cyclase/tetratricopeptide (TPR) repeat protein
LEYKPKPVDTSGMVLSREIAQLGELLAKNAHEHWAQLRIAQGWHYGSHSDQTRRENPNLIPYEDLPESEKEFDRQTAIETIKTLLAAGYTIQPPALAPGSNENPPAAPHATQQITGASQLLADPAEIDLAEARKLWIGRDPDVWSGNPQTYALFAERMLGLGEPLMAYDIAAEGIKVLPRDARLRQLLALALARSGAAESANTLLMELYREGLRDEETLGLLARTHKDLAAEAADASTADQHLRCASGFYALAYELRGGYWSGINAATLAVFLGEPRRATALARSVRQQCREKLESVWGNNTERYWLLSTLGEAALVLEDWREAEDWYGQAIEAGRGNWGSLQSTRHNARLLGQHLDGDTARIDQMFHFPAVTVFAGHMIDRPGRPVPRFPPAVEQAVKNAIRRRIKELKIGFAYASAACGADILFHEAMLEAKGEIHIILPYEKELFMRDCVSFAPTGNWEERWRRVLAEATEVQEVSQRCRTHSIAYQFANRILHGLAAIRAGQLETSLIPLAVWDCDRGEGPGGTADTIRRWRNLGLNLEIIDLREILAAERPDLVKHAASCTKTASTSSKEPAETFSSEIRALLFGDAEGFSKLTDEEVPRFVEHFMGLIGTLIAGSQYPPLVKNTWGDGLYFVFADVRDAGRFALDLRDAVRATDWQGKGLPPLKLRVGLHAGPVHCCVDPVTRSTSYIGAQVSRAARIEPVTPGGQVYASQAFAALAAERGVEEFRCDYVGQTAMAKKYGVFPTYVVLRRSLNATHKQVDQLKLGRKTG